MPESLVKSGIDKNYKRKTIIDKRKTIVEKRRTIEKVIDQYDNGIGMGNGIGMNNGIGMDK